MQIVTSIIKIINDNEKVIIGLYVDDMMIEEAKIYS